MIPNNPSKPRGISGNALRTWGYLFLFFGIAGQSVIQNQILGLGAVSPAELAAAWDADPAIMGFATLALVFQAVQTCAAPIFAFLLVEGFLHTSNFKNYLVRVLALALVSELPYNLAMGGSLINLSGRNPVFALALGLILMKLYSQYPEKTAAHIGIKLAVTVAAFVWVKMLGIAEGMPLVVLTAVFWYFRNKPNYRNMAGCAAAAVCSLFSMFYIFSPMGVLALYNYNGEVGNKNKVVNYAAYPVILLCVGLVAKFI